VFLDGCFWHGCPDHHTKSKTNAAFWEGKVRRNRARDLETNRILTDADWYPVRIWEHEDPLEAAERIAAIVETRLIGLAEKNDAPQLLYDQFCDQHISGIWLSAKVECN
jgi:DNA mismatch endonuclease (patch repair protein)